MAPENRALAFFIRSQIHYFLLLCARQYLSCPWLPQIPVKRDDMKYLEKKNTRAWKTDVLQDTGVRERVIGVFAECIPYPETSVILSIPLTHLMVKRLLCILVRFPDWNLGQLHQPRSWQPQPRWPISNPTHLLASSL